VGIKIIAIINLSLLTFPKTMKLKVGVLASTRGTNLQAMIDDLKSNNLDYEIVCVISNVYEAGALEKAKNAKIPAVFLDPSGKNREEYDEKLIEVLKKYGVDMICLIGYMKILSPVFVKAFANKIINVHPSIIPLCSGKGFHGNKVHECVLNFGCKIAGMTIHLVDQGVDTGKIICQKSCSLTDSDDIKSMKNKVQSLEKEWYPKVVQAYAKTRDFNSLSL